MQLFGSDNKIKTENAPVDLPFVAEKIRIHVVLLYILPLRLQVRGMARTDDKH